MADSEGQKWLDEHKHRGEQLMYVFYALGALALVSIAMEWKRPKAALAGGNYDTNAGHGHARRWRLHCLHGRTHPAQRVPLRSQRPNSAPRSITVDKPSECFGETLPGARILLPFNASWMSFHSRSAALKAPVTGTSWKTLPLAFDPQRHNFLSYCLAIGPGELD